MTNTKPRRGMSFRLKAVLWALVSAALGVAGGYLAEYISVPFYFGFFFMWVLTGLVALFVLAVHVTNEQNQNRDKSS